MLFRSIFSCKEQDVMKHTRNILRIEYMVICVVAPAPLDWFVEKWTMGIYSILFMKVHCFSDAGGSSVATGGWYS